MKPALTILAFFLLQIIHAQSTTTWFVDGARWRYSTLSSGGPGEEEYYLKGDTVVDGQACKEISLDGFSFFMYERNDSVFSRWNGTFELLYDMTAEAGDTVDLGYMWMVYNKFVVDSIGIYEFQGKPLKAQYGRLINDVNPYGEQESFVIERLGSNAIHLMEHGTFATEVLYYLDCYRDDELPFQLCNASPQNGFRFFKDSTVYDEKSGVWFTYTGIQYHIAGDTTIENGVGLKVYSNKVYQKTSGQYDSLVIYNESPKLIGILAQDAVNKKVYFKRLAIDWNKPATISSFYFPKDSFILLYDFNLYNTWVDVIPISVNDTILYEKDSILLNDGEWYNRYYFFSDIFEPDPTIDTTYFWIEGIGGSHGLFTSYIPSFTWDAGHGVNCVSRKGELLYKPNSGACQAFTSTSTLLLGNGHLTVFPNPATDFFSLNNDNYQPLTINIFSSNGKLVFRVENYRSGTNVYLPDNMPMGLYILKIQDENGQSAWRKLLKH